MYQHYDSYMSIQELRRIIDLQSQLIKKLEKDVVLIRKEIELLKKNKSFSIEKIEYKFDQLKIETLTGTLNIGITPNSSGSIEELNVENQIKEDITFPNTKLHINMYKNIIEQIDEYLRNGILDQLQLLENKYDKTIDSDKREQIINDIRTQIEKQINAYINTKKEINTDKIKDFENDTIYKVIKDINIALENYFKSLTKEI